MKLIIGLGNVGAEYDKTRHNIGFMVLDNYLGNVLWKNDKFAFSYMVKTNNENVLFIKPTTFMNLSGKAVLYYASYYKIDCSDILVIQDDLDLPLGKVRTKINSSAGGHNGIKDIIKCLNSNEFLRIKVGISKNDKDIVNYVLGKFSKTEEIVLNDSFKITNNIIDDFINNISVDKIMNRYN